MINLEVLFKKNSRRFSNLGVSIGYSQNSGVDENLFLCSSIANPVTPEKFAFMRIGSEYFFYYAGHPADANLSFNERISPEIKFIPAFINFSRILEASSEMKYYLAVSPFLPTPFELTGIVRTELEEIPDAMKFLYKILRGKKKMNEKFNLVLAEGLS